MPVWSVEGSTFANELEPEPEPGYEMVELRDELVRRSRLARTFGLRKADDVQAIVIGALRRTPGAESPVWRDIVAKQKLRKVVHKHVTRPRQELEREGRLQALHVRLGKEAERLELYNPKVKPQAASAAAFARAVGVDRAAGARPFFDVIAETQERERQAREEATKKKERCTDKDKPAAAASEEEEEESAYRAEKMRLGML